MIPKIKCLLTKYRELIAYVIVGGLTTVISIASFSICFDVAKLGTLISNIISWILAVAFAFFTNRAFVFQNKDSKIIQQCIKFFSGRLVTLGLETILLLIMVDALTFNATIAKIIVQFVILASNYTISKFFVFNNNNRKDNK